MQAPSPPLSLHCKDRKFSQNFDSFPNTLCDMQTKVSIRGTGHLGKGKGVPLLVEGVSSFKTLLQNEHWAIFRRGIAHFLI